MNRLRLILISAIAASALGVAGCGGSSAEGEYADEGDTAGGEGWDEGEEATADIVDTAIAAGSFGTLVAAVQAAELVDTLRGPGPFTVFAPTDEAFAALPEGTVENLLQPENRAQLVAILTYHVVAGEVYAEQVVEMTSATTVQGSELSIDVDDDGVRVGDANVVQTDVAASNGVIHVIDAVLMPPS